MKKIIALFLSLAMIMTLSPVWVLAAEESAPEDNLVLSQEQDSEPVSQEDVEEAVEPGDEPEMLSALGDMETSYDYSFESTIKNNIGRILRGKEYSLNSKYTCSTNDPDFASYTSPVPVDINSIEVKSGANSDVAEIKYNSTNKEFRVKGLKKGTTTVVVSFTLAKGETEEKDASFEVEVEVYEQLYNLEFKKYFAGSGANNYTYLPGEEFKLYASPICEENNGFEDNYEYVRRVTGDEFWDDFTITYASSSSNVSVEADNDDPYICNVSILDSASAISNEDYSITASLKNEDGDVVASKKYAFNVHQAAKRLVLENTPAWNMAKGAKATVSAHLYEYSYNGLAAEHITKTDLNDTSEPSFELTTEREGFTIKKDINTNNKWTVTRNTKKEAKLTLSASYYDDGQKSEKLVIIFDSLIGIKPAEELTFENDEYIVKGSAFKAYLDDDSLDLLRSLGYTKLVWEASYADPQTDVEKELPSKYYTTSGSTLSISSTNVNALATLLAVKAEDDIGEVFLKLKAIDDEGDVLAVAESEIEYILPSKHLEDAKFGVETGSNSYDAIRGESYFVPKSNSLYVINAANPDGDSYSATVTSVTSGSSAITVKKETKGWTVTPAKVSGPVKLTINYSSSGKAGTEYIYVTVKDHRYSINIEHENSYKDMLFGGSKKIKAVCYHEYYDEESKTIDFEYLDDVDWSIDMDRDSDGATTVDSSFAPTQDWTWKLNAKPLSKYTIDPDEYMYLSDSYTVTASQGGVALAKGYFELDIESEYYIINQKITSFDLTSIDANGYTANDLADVSFYSPEHPEGVAADGENDSKRYTLDILGSYQDLEEEDGNEDVFTKMFFSKLMFRDTTSIAKALNNGYTGFTVRLIVNTGAIEEEYTTDLYFKVTCSHNKVAGVPIDKATLEDAGLEGCYHCNACGRNFADEDYTQPIIAPAVIPRIAKVALEKPSYEYTGSEIKPKAVITDSKGKRLVEGIDYTMDYEDNVNVTASDDASAIITFCGKYEDETTVYFTITPAPQKVAAKASIINENPDNPGVLYVGKNTAKVELEDSLIAGTNEGEIIGCVEASKASKAIATVNKVGNDYIITPKKSGTAEFKVTLGPSGNYKQTTGTLKVVVKTPTKISAATLLKTSMGYTGEGLETGVKSVTAKVGKKTITLDPSLYTIDYSNNVNVGKKAVAKVTVNSDCFDYYGTITKNFTITKANQTILATLGDNSYTYINGLEAFIGQYSDTPCVVLGPSGFGKNIGKITVTSSNAKVAKVVASSETGKYNIVLSGKTGTVKITVAAAGDGNYNKATKVYTVKVAAPAKITSSMISFTGDYADGSIAYDGTAKKIDKSNVVVKNGNTVLDPSKYDVDVEGEATEIGAVKVTVKVHDDADAYGFVNGISASKNYNIVLATMSAPSLTAGTKSFTASWEKPESGTVNGYEVRYSLKSSMASSKTVKLGSGDTLTTTVKKLAAKKTYYVQTRAYTTVGKTKYYSDWSEAQTVVTK